MNTRSKLHIVRASAGSGKTFRLTLQYLSGLFSESGNFRHILAVTFTNKAAEEMKSRIISVLHSLATGKDSVYLPYLKKETDLEEKNIRLKADIILKKILHNYSFFSVKTIDAFFQQVIRSFTREMGIQTGFAIELDEKPLLTKAIDNLLDCVDEDPDLLKWVLKFAESRLEDSRGWDLKKGMLNLGNEIFKEKYKEKSHIINEKIRDKDFMNSYISELIKITSGFEKKLVSIGKKAYSSIIENGYTVNDFFYKDKGPAGYLKKLSEGNITEPKVYVKNVLKDPDKWISGKVTNSALMQFCIKTLHPLLQESFDFYNSNIVSYQTSKTIFANIYTLGILSDISSHINKLTRERNLFLLSNSAELINRVIDNNDAPFIYEKTGNYFRQFLIDEFQDTSGFQWKNFKPLISNSLSNGNNCLVVGDVKQSVYRWRNSNWEIMAGEVVNDFYSEAVNLETLETNFRSAPNLVNFNNNLFKSLPSLMSVGLSDYKGVISLDVISSLYSDVLQKTGEGISEEGYVDFSFYESDDRDKQVFEMLVNSLNQLQDAGYGLKDIAVLTRSRKEGKTIADFLLDYKQKNNTDYRYDVVSDESLYLVSSASVSFITSVLRYFIDPENDINNYFILTEYLILKNKEKEIQLPEYDNSDPAGSMKIILPKEFFILSENKKSYSLIELVKRITAIFKLNAIDGELGYLMAFNDLVSDYTNHYSSYITSFLEYWSEACTEKSIPGSDFQDAIRILTIHKAKGLEFKAVIIPYCDWEIDKKGRSILWCKPEVEPFNKIEALPVIYKNSLAETIFAEDFYEEQLKANIDSLNLLYVALTRAKKALICFSEKKVKEDNCSRISGFILQAFKDDKGFFNRYFNPEKNQIIIGTMKNNTEKSESTGMMEINKIEEYDRLKSLKINFQGKEHLLNSDKVHNSLDFGRLMHELFSNIETLKDIDPAIEKMYYAGKINHSEKELLKHEVNTLFMDIQANSWFSGEWKNINERNILHKDNVNRRPDRVLVKDNKAIVIDYKFGNKEFQEHKDQVLEYRSLLMEAGYINVECYLWYITKRKVVMVK